MTYGCHIKASDEKEKVTNFTIGTDGLVEILGAFYGDFIILDDKSLKGLSYKAGWIETKETLAKDVLLLVNEKEEWIKVYVERSLKDGSRTKKSPAPHRSCNRRPSHSLRKSP
jgi:hypothetical protein